MAALVPSLYVEHYCECCAALRCAVRVQGAYLMVYNMATTLVEALFGANSQQLTEWCAAALCGERRAERSVLLLRTLCYLQAR